MNIPEMGAVVFARLVQNPSNPKRFFIKWLDGAKRYWLWLCANPSKRPSKINQTSHTRPRPHTHAGIIIIFSIDLERKWLDGWTDWLRAFVYAGFSRPTFFILARRVGRAAL